MVFAVLTRKNRARLFDFVGKWGGVIERGVVKLPVRGTINKKLIGYVLDLARRVSLPLDDVPKRLAINATGKDQVEIRLRNLELLQEHYGTEAIARQAGIKALKDRRSVIRFQAAVFLRELDMIAKIAAIEAEPVDTRLRAMRFLTENAPPDKVLPLLEKLLDSLNPAVRKEAIADLGWLRHRPAVGRLCNLVTTTDPETAAVLASALAKIGDPAAEPTVLTLLERREEGLKIAAANALGHVGTATAVEPLMALVGSGLSDLGRAAEEAIARIQSRLGDVEAGRLTLAKLAEREGALSLSREGGELSLPKGDKPLSRGDKGNRAKRK
jgi:HEAT repeat protein